MPWLLRLMEGDKRYSLLYPTCVLVHCNTRCIPYIKIQGRSILWSCDSPPITPTLLYIFLRRSACLHYLLIHVIVDIRSWLYKWSVRTDFHGSGVLLSFFDLTKARARFRILIVSLLGHRVAHLSPYFFCWQNEEELSFSINREGKTVQGPSPGTYYRKERERD
jgi:hypothetical protein